MIVRSIILALSLAALAIRPSTACAVSAGEIAASPDTTDADVRGNPVFGEDRETGSESRRYSFIHYNANRICLNGADWSGLRHILHEAAAGRGTLDIVHIGDSHIQAEGNTSRVRRHLQRRYGSAGRGLITPFRLAGTNQPVDYRITSSASFASAKLMRTPWPTAMGFTGISLAMPASAVSFDISNAQPFDAIAVYGRGEISISAITAGSKEVDFDVIDGSNATLAVLDHAVSACTITIDAPGANIYGFELRHNDHGVRYHAIGNNGATFSQYNSIGGFGASLRQLAPDLVIVSLGTNEAFGKISDEAFMRQIDAFVSDIRTHNPGVRILLTTPSECQRSVYTTVRTRRKRRRRAKIKRVRSFAVNSNVARLRSAILRYGEQHHIATWDWYDVAGGNGSSAQWLSSHLLGGDRIHRTWTGYHLEGDLLAEALDAALTGKAIAKIPASATPAEPQNDASRSASNESKTSTSTTKHTATAKKSRSSKKKYKSTKPSKKRNKGRRRRRR